MLCPVCRSPCTDPPLYRYTATQAAAHFCPPTRDASRNARLVACISRLWGQDSCEILRCKACGFAFGNPFVGGDEEFYGIRHETKDYPGWHWDYDVAMAGAIAPLGGGSILEIGAGVGTFLASLGSKWQTYAVEASESNRADLAKRGIAVVRDLAAEVAAGRGTFQAVVLFQTLEHIAEFKTVLAQCRELLAPDGRLVLTVPHCDAMLDQERILGWPDMPPNHINKFTPESLTRALSDAGFTAGPKIDEPSSWLLARHAVFMSVQADAMKEGSLASAAYRLSSDALRRAALMVLGVGAFVRLLPYPAELQRGRSFGMVASPRQ